MNDSDVVVVVGAVDKPLRPAAVRTRAECFVYLFVCLSNYNTESHACFLSVFYYVVKCVALSNSLKSKILEPTLLLFYFLFDHPG